MSIETVFDCEGVRSSVVPAISVVVAARDAERWIAQTLESVCTQDAAVPFEVIVVDDGSRDHSAEIATAVLKARGARGRVLRIPHSGPSRARNVGWRAARGAWIQFLDADDLLHPLKLREQWPTCEAASRDVALVYSDWARLELRGAEWHTRLPLCAPRVSENTLEALIRSEHFVPFASALVRHDWLERTNGFDEEQWVIEDVNLLIRIALMGGQFVHVSTEFPSFLYRQLENSLSHSRAQQFAEGCYANAKVVEEYWRQSGPLTSRRRILLAQIYVSSANLVGTRSVSRSREMLRGLEELVGSLAWSSTVARRLFMRGLAYRTFGHRRASACERAYLRAVAPVRALRSRIATHFPHASARRGVADA